MKAKSAKILPEINNLHQLVASDMLQVNDIILSNIHSNELTTEKVGTYLFNSTSKRLRPMLTIYFSKIFGYQGQDHLKLAAAVEFVHTATLLHDDVVDNSEMRRFQKSVHLVWNNQTSILVGDFLFAQSFKLMVQTGSLAALSSLSDASATIASGELSQLVKMQEKRILNREEYMQIIDAKTATLFATACEVGAIIAGEPNEICSDVKQLGSLLGKIFQISDDILDYFGSNQNLGKNVGDDFAEAKVTLPLIILDENCSKLENDFIISILQKEDRDEKDFHAIIKLMQKHQIYPLLQQALSTLSAEAEGLINNLDITSEHKENLTNLVYYFSNRCT